MNCLSSLLITYRNMSTLSKMSELVKVALLQLRCTSNKERNYNICHELINDASKKGAKMVFLPENFDFVSENKDQSFELCEPLTGELIDKYRKLALENHIYLSLGGFHRKDAAVNGKIFNSHVIIDDSGAVLAVYDKIHLFDVDIPNSISLKESNVVEAGHRVVAPVNTPIGLVGLAICYDMRFPELSQALREMSADILTYPSAFTDKTGAAHWHLLLRARAIENQCFVIAAAQEGQHNKKRCSYGHSIVIDPWGNIVAERTDAGEGLLLCDIDRSVVAKYRTEMPVHVHRRLDLFPSPCQQGQRIDIGERPFVFGPHEVVASCVFFRSRLSYAFVNISPLVPGHVLVSPIRAVGRLEELSAVEVADIYAVVRHVGPRLATHFSAQSLTISQQDGPEAGQTVPHVHVHVLPRKPGDFPENDDIYKKLQTHDRQDNVQRKFRTVEAMSIESADFRRLFY